MKNPFKPTAGATPPLLVGRQPILDDFQESLDDGAGAPNLLQLITGARGVGKTVMLNELGTVAQSNGWVVIHVTAGPGMLDKIAYRARLATSNLGSPATGKTTTRFNLKTPLGGVSREYVRDEELSFSWAEDVSELLDILAPHETGLCITVDEIHSLDDVQMQALAGETQMLIRQGSPIAMIMAGLPKAVEDLLAGDRSPTTFLRRAERQVLKDVPVSDVAESFEEIISNGGRSITEELAYECARATNGYPFMIQLVGYHTWRQGRSGPITRKHVGDGILAAQARLGALVHEPALVDLSEVDRTFLVKMAEDEGPSRLSDIAKRLGKTSQYASVYRDRLLKAGMIRSAGFGKVGFATPYLREYLRDHAAHLMAHEED